MKNNSSDSLHVDESPLADVHSALGAKICPFGGWRMPLSYPMGTVHEHLACRRNAAIFDVSHLGTVTVEGPDAFDRLQSAFTNDLGKIAPGRAQYTHLLDPEDASVLDDIIVWWRDEESFDVMPNASNTARVLDAVGGIDVTRDRVVLAVQGPQATQIASVVLGADHVPKRFAVRMASWQGTPCTVAGTGYTGESGLEVSVPSEAAAAMWAAFTAAGAEPAGLGARDTLRLEAALPLHGHELGPGITSLQAGLGWVVAWGKPSFRGRDALQAERDRGVARKLYGIATAGRRPPRSECIVRHEGVEVGMVSSGNFSPMLGHGIALAFLPPGIAQGACVEIDLRGTVLSGMVVPTPFIDKR